MLKKSTMFISSSEPGVRLELIVARPLFDGPYPTLIFNHGSTGNAKPSVIAKSECPATVQNYFTQRGWQVLFPQRRGRGKSGGKYAEGVAADGTGYSCDPEIAMGGFDRAAKDLDAVMAHVETRGDVDFSRIAIGGASRGGILSIAYAGMRSPQFCGAINFNGGWLGKACPAYETVNPPIFRFGATAGITTLWIHGTKDPYYPMKHCRGNFDSYVSAGGRGTFLAASGGHGLIYKPELWKTTMDTYMGQIERG